MSIVSNFMFVDTVFFPALICMPELDARTSKITTRSNIGAPKMHFSTQITKMPQSTLGWPKVKQGQNPRKKNIVHGFISNLSSSEIFGNFDQVWLPIGLETLILIWSLERVETNVIAKIIKFLVQKLFMGWNRS